MGWALIWVKYPIHNKGWQGTKDLEENNCPARGPHSCFHAGSTSTKSIAGTASGIYSHNLTPSRRA